MRRLIVTLGVVGILLAGAGPAVAHKPDNNAKAERMCEREGGTFIDLDGIAYGCLLPTAASPREIRAAARECKKHGGALFVGVGNLAYVCVLPGGHVLGGVLHGPNGPVGGGLGGLQLTPVIIR